MLKNSSPVSFELASCLTPLVLQVRSAHQRKLSCKKKDFPHALIMEFSEHVLQRADAHSAHWIFNSLPSRSQCRWYAPICVHSMCILIICIYHIKSIYYNSIYIYSLELCCGVVQNSKTSRSPRFRKAFKPFRAQPE